MRRGLCDWAMYKVFGFFFLLDLLVGFKSGLKLSGVSSARHNFDDGTKCKDWINKYQHLLFFFFFNCFNDIQPTDPADFHSSLCSFGGLHFAVVLPWSLHSAQSENWTLACCCYWESLVSSLGCYFSLKDVIVPLASGRSSSCLHVMQKATASLFSLWRAASATSWVFQPSFSVGQNVFAGRDLVHLLFPPFVLFWGFFALRLKGNWKCLLPLCATDDEKLFPVFVATEVW